MALNELYFGAQMFAPISIMVWNKIYHRSLFDDFRFAEGYIFEDTQATPMLLNKAHKIGCLNVAYYNYNIHLGIESTSGMRANILKTRSKVYMAKSVYDFFSERSDLENIKWRTFDIFTNAIMDSYGVCIKNKTKSDSWRNLYYDLKQQAADVKPAIMQRGMTKKERLFYFSPSIFSTSKTLYQNLKKWKYRIKCILTRKN